MLGPSDEVQYMTQVLFDITAICAQTKWTHTQQKHYYMHKNSHMFWLNVSRVDCNQIPGHTCDAQ